MTAPDLHARLVNWAMYVRDVAKQDISATGRFCDDLARRAGQNVHGGESKARREIDDIDGQRVEDAWRRCSQPTKDLLKVLYVWNRSPAEVCRRLRIPHRPKHIFDLRRYHAETEIERILGEPEQRRVARSTTRPPKGVDAG